MNIKSIILNFIFIISILLMLSGCGRSDTCLEADDFGFAKVTISSRYDPTEIFGMQQNEIAPWKDDGLVLDGNPLYIEVKNWNYKSDENSAGTVSAWCPWYGDKDHASTLSKFCERLPPCNFKGAENCYDANGDPTSNACVTKAMCTDTVDAQITNAPCLMTKGVGLYALLTKQGYDANLSINTISHPEGITMHLGDPHVGYTIPSMSNDGTSTNAGGILYDYDGNHNMNSSRQTYVQGKLYFKILDHFYDDNNGQYRVFIKSGVVNGGWDPISWCIDLVKTALFGVDPTGSVNSNYGSGGSGIVPSIYSSVVANSSFIDAIRAMLTLYVIFSAIGFLIGSLELTQKELLTRVFKITVIVALISPSSWDFFNTNLFIWFYEGTGFVINILEEVAASGPGSTNPLSFFFSEEIFIKLSSLLFATYTGWIYIIIYLIMLLFLVIIYFDAAVIYMTALIMMGVLISIAPIFIALYLFEQTKSFFDNWLKQLMAYAVQMILVYAGILFMTMIIRNQIYNTLGFPTCAIEFPNIGDITIFKWYFPKIQSWGDNPKQVVMPIPKDHFQTPQDSKLAFGFTQENLTDSDFCKANPSLCNNIATPEADTFCTAYECLGSRYPDLPFLDPNDSYESTLINQMRGGYIGDFSGLAIIVICIYLMDHFNKSTVSMAKFLSNTVGNQADSTRAAASASAAFGAMAMKPVHYADKRLGVSEKANALRAGVHDFFAQAKYKMIDKPWADYKIGSLKEDALNNSRWSKAMRQGAESSTGMSFKEATEFNNQYKKGHYTSSLHANISGATGDHVNGAIASKAILERLSKGKAEDIKKIAAEELFKNHPKYKSLKGKIDFSQLDKEHQTQINEIVKGMKPMLDAKSKQETFQEAYAKAFIDMSNEGRGFLQKRSSIARWGQDVKNRMRAAEQQAEQDRLIQGEKFLSKYEGMKRLVSGGLIGNERSQILYNDSHMRTMDEQLSNTIAERAHYELNKSVNRTIVSEGKDIQRPEFRSAQYQSLIDAHLQSSVMLQLQYADKERKKPLLMGDTYIQTKMTDHSIREMIDQLQAKEQQILKSDPYLKDTAQYAGNQEATDYLNNRAKLIHNTVQTEIERINEIRTSRGMDAYYGRNSSDATTQSYTSQDTAYSRTPSSKGTYTETTSHSQDTYRRSSENEVEHDSHSSSGYTRTPSSKDEEQGQYYNPIDDGVSQDSRRVGSKSKYENPRDTSYERIEASNDLQDQGKQRTSKGSKVDREDTDYDTTSHSGLRTPNTSSNEDVSYNSDLNTQSQNSERGVNKEHEWHSIEEDLYQDTRRTGTTKESPIEETTEHTYSNIIEQSTETPSSHETEKHYDNFSSKEEENIQTSESSQSSSNIEEQRNEATTSSTFDENTQKDQSEGHIQMNEDRTEPQSEAQSINSTNEVNEETSTTDITSGSMGVDLSNQNKVASIDEMFTAEKEAATKHEPDIRKYEEKPTQVEEKKDEPVKTSSNRSKSDEEQEMENRTSGKARLRKPEGSGGNS